MMTMGSQKEKQTKTLKAPFVDKMVVTRFVDTSGYMHKGKQKALWLLIIKSLV